MKVFYVGSFAPPHSTENDVRKAFEHLGWEVDRCEEKEFIRAFAAGAYGPIFDRALSADLLIHTLTQGSYPDPVAVLDLWAACARSGISTASIHLDLFYGLGSPKGDGPQRHDLPAVHPMFKVAHVFCLTADAEIFTADGWRTYDQLEVGDEVLTLNHETGLSEWQPALGVHSFEVRDEPMLAMSRRQRHLSLSTLGHRWPIMSARGHRRWRTSDSLNPSHRIITAALCADLPTEPKWTDAFVELVAWYWTEGTATRGRTGAIAQSEMVNPRYCERIRRCLYTLFGPPAPTLRYRQFRGVSPCAFQNCGWPAHANGLCDAHLRQRARGLHLRPVRRRSANPGFPAPPPKPAPAWREFPTDRGVTQFVLNWTAHDLVREVALDRVVSREFLRSLTAAQLDLFIETSIDGDGYRRGGCADLQQNDAERTEAFDFACILSGRATRTYLHTSGRCPMWGVRIRPTSGFRVRSMSRETYSGIVWCPTTANGTWLARVNGQCFFTGNTADGAHQDEFARDGVNHHWLPPGVNHEEAIDVEAGPVTVTRHNGETFGVEPGRYLVGFAGSDGYHPEWPHRPQLVQWLRETYGDRFLHVGGSSTHRVIGLDLNRLYANVPVWIGDSCLTAPDNAYFSDRVPETWGRGGFLIHPRVDALNDRYGEALPGTAWEAGDWDALHAVIEHFLAHADAREQIRERLVARTRAHDTYVHRVAQMLGVIGLDYAGCGCHVVKLVAGGPYYGEPAPELESVRILRLEPGDQLVATIASEWNQEAAGRLQQILRERFPDHEVLVLAGVDLTVIHEESA